MTKTKRIATENPMQPTASVRTKAGKKFNAPAVSYAPDASYARRQHPRAVSCEALAQEESGKRKEGNANPESTCSILVPCEESTTPRPRRKSAAPALPYAPEASKHERLLALLQRTEGATIAELQAATNWQAHSVRGFLSATVRKKLQLPLMAELRPTGERVYRIVGESAHA